MIWSHYSRTLHNDQGPNLHLLLEGFLKPYLQHVYVLWHYVEVVGRDRWYIPLSPAHSESFGFWTTVCSLSSKIWPTSGRVTKCQDKWAFINSYVTNRIRQILTILLQNYTSTLNTKIYMCYNFEISLLYGNFHSCSSCYMRFDLYHTFLGNNKIPFPWGLLSLKKKVFPSEIFTVLNKVLKYKSFSTTRKYYFSHCFAS